MKALFLSIGIHHCCILLSILLSFIDLNAFVSSIVYDYADEIGVFWGTLKIFNLIKYSIFIIMGERLVLWIKFKLWQ